MSDRVILERTIRLTNLEMKSVALQWHRIKAIKPDDANSSFQQWADLRFFILSLNRLRKTAEIALALSDTEILHSINEAIDKFDRSLPKLKRLRNIAEHQNEYAVDNPNRHVQAIDHKQLEVDSWGDTEYEWLGVRLNIDDAMKAANDLFNSLKAAREDLSKP